MGQQIPLAVVDAMLTLCNFNQVMRRDFIDAQYFAVSPETIAVVERFRAEAESYLHGGEEELPPTVARLLKRVWRDRGFKATFRNRMRMRSNQIGDTMDYYFDKIESLAVRDWRPSDEDILRFRYRTSGLMAQYLLDPVTRALFHIIDFGAFTPPPYLLSTYPPYSPSYPPHRWSARRAAQVDARVPCR
ncbi:MAG: hypothetical protein MHM6MM_009485, partial [Cercozoa sp. M6MM]